MPLRDDTFGIGDLARLTGVPVRTIRFYCDEGIIASVRSTGNHRRFDGTAVESRSCGRARGRAGPELDRFVAAHATVRGAGDTPAFRRELLANVEPDRDPRVRRYWRLVGEVSGEPATLGTTLLWLTDSLERSITP
ncbi:hypothetical protein GCM10022419_084820 [Nonomuraea rosea]|uniref:HTH merR-type domain-containing protein n=1 Tax=Nonomuraea rosea TaxID=638574 RepID=A0ABP6YRJ6_9ACTN